MSAPCTVSVSLSCLSNTTVGAWMALNCQGVRTSSFQYELALQSEITKVPCTLKACSFFSNPDRISFPHHIVLLASPYCQLLLPEKFLPAFFSLQLSFDSEDHQPPPTKLKTSKASGQPLVRKARGPLDQMHTGKERIQLAMFNFQKHL